MLPAGGEASRDIYPRLRARAPRLKLPTDLRGHAHSPSIQDCDRHTDTISFKAPDALAGSASWAWTCAPGVIDPNRIVSLIVLCGGAILGGSKILLLIEILSPTNNFEMYDFHYMYLKIITSNIANMISQSFFRNCNLSKNVLP